MRRLGLTTFASAVGVTAIGLVAGDPRGSRDFAGAASVFLAGLALAVVVGLCAWGARPRRAWRLLVPVVITAISGGLSGWIAAAELSGQPQSPLRAGDPLGRVTFQLGLTALGMALPALAISALGLLTARGKARA